MPSVRTTIAIGVSIRLPFSLMQNLTPFHSSLTGKPLAQPADEPRLVVPVLVLAGLAGEVDRGQDQEGAEEVEDPAELR